MNHYASPSFWEYYQKLPPRIREASDKQFLLLKENPEHPSLHFKRTGEFWSVRVTQKYRALAVEIDKGLLWFWIGPHEEYERILN